jgi:uncharacterized protein (TIGR02611 family)
MERRRLRERLVLSQIHPHLDADEQVVQWAHVHAVSGRRQGVLACTRQRCVVHWVGDAGYVVFRWEDLRAWHVERPAADRPVLELIGAEDHVAVEFRVSSKPRLRKASAVFDTVASLAPPDAHGTGWETGELPLQIPAARRGWRGHTRRIVVTIAGLFVILVGLLFASPLVPGPGALTVLAGLALLASEFDWAKDLQHWLRRAIDRFTKRLRAWRRRRREAKNAATPSKS